MRVESGAKLVATVPAKQGSFQVDGTCYVLYAFDIGLSIDLEDCDRRITSAKQRERIRHKRHAPARYFESQSPPLRITTESQPVDVGRTSTAETVDLVVHDFGTVTVQFSLRLEGRFDDLVQLSDGLYDNHPLREAAHMCVSRLFDLIRPTISRPRIARPVEDYVIFDIQALSPEISPAKFIDDNRSLVARILRSETAALSDQEIEDALACRISYGPDDHALIDWASAMVFGTLNDDVRTVLELANSELLEMRFLDEQLDDTLEQAYRSLVYQRNRSLSLPSRAGADLRRIARLQVDNAILHEAAHNALKLLGDQYLARVYRLASQRFHLKEWDESIVRKLQTLESIYQKHSDRAATRRMEVLEWIIIVLIAVSIALPFLPWAK